MEITSELTVFCFILEEKRRAESPSYQMWLTEQQQLEDFQNEENERIRVEKHRLWLLEEEAARERWLKQQQRLERLKAEKAKQEVLFLTLLLLSFICVMWANFFCYFGYII